MIDREWWVQVNLDDLFHVTSQMETSEERGHWLEGFMVGAQGHQARDTWTGFKRIGFEFGAACHAEAVAFRASKSAAGRASVDARRAKYGSASPNTVRTLIEHTSEQATEQSAEQSAEQAPNQPTTNNQQPTTNSKKPKIQFSAEAEAIYRAYPKHVERPEALAEIERALKLKPFEFLLEAVQAFALANKGQNPKYIVSCGRWMKRQRWDDDRSTWGNGAESEPSPPTVEEWMSYGQEIATTSRTRGGATWPRDLAVSAYHQCAANGWKGVTDWKAKLSAECLRWVGTQNGMGR